jgi:hypothetical protein
VQSTSINPNTAARARWQPYRLVNKITLLPVKEAVAEIIGSLEQIIDIPRDGPPVVICEIDNQCLPVNGLTIEFFMPLLGTTLARILQVNKGVLKRLPREKNGYFLLEYTAGNKSPAARHES